MQHQIIAYIDPAAAGQIIAVVTGVVITLGVMAGVLRTRIMMFFQRRKIAGMEKKIGKEAEQKDLTNTEK